MIMRRRAFISFLGIMTVLPRFTSAETKRFMVGILVIGNRDPTSFVTAFMGEMKRLGYADGQDIRFELRSGEAGAGNLRELADELVKAKADVIVARLTPAVIAARDATSQIPIVMIGAGDPIGNGLVTSLARPGGNVTGLGGLPELISKNVELVRELLPSAKRLGVVANAPDPFTKSFLAQIRIAAEKQRFELNVVAAQDSYELAGSFHQIAADNVEAVVVQPSLPTKACADLALAAHLPTVSPIETFTGDGGLLSYSGRTLEQIPLAAGYVDKILRGARPAELPVQLATQFELKINLRTAKGLGLVIPPLILARADEVIE